MLEQFLVASLAGDGFCWIHALMPTGAVEGGVVALWQVEVLDGSNRFDMIWPSKLSNKPSKRHSGRLWAVMRQAVACWEMVTLKSGRRLRIFQKFQKSKMTSFPGRYGSFRSCSDQGAWLRQVNQAVPSTEDFRMPYRNWWKWHDFQEINIDD